MPKRDYGGTCIGGPLDGEIIRSECLHISLSTGGYVYCSTKANTWIWHPKVEAADDLNQQLEGK